MAYSSLSNFQLSISSKGAFSYEWNKAIDRNASCANKFGSSLKALFKALFYGYEVCKSEVIKDFLEPGSNHVNSFFGKEYRKLLDIKSSLKDPTNNSVQGTKRIRRKILVGEVKQLIGCGNFGEANRYLSEENIKLLSPEECLQFFTSNFKYNHNCSLEHRKMLSKLLLTGHCDSMACLLDKGSENALSFFESHGIVSGLRYVLKMGIVDVNRENGYGNRILMVAATNGRTETLEALLDGGANPNLRNKKGYAALHCAIMNGSVGCTMVLLNAYGISLNIRGKDSMTPLHLLAMWYNKDCVIELMRKHGVDLNARNSDLQTPLHIACAMGKLDYINDLLQLPDAIMVNVKDGGDWTPLHMAAYKGHVDCVKRLLSEKSIFIDEYNSNNETALDCAKAMHNEECVNLLEKAIEAKRIRNVSNKLVL